MGIGVPTGAGTTSGTANVSALPSGCPIPACAVGARLLLIAQQSTGTNTMTAPSGWSLVAGPLDDGASTQRAYLFTKVAASGDSGGSVPVGWNGSGRVAAGVVQVPGGAAVDVVVGWVDATADGTLTVPAITPTVNDALELVMAGDRFAAGIAGAVSPPAGWGELIDILTANTSNPRLGIWAASRQLTGQAGTAQSTADASYTAGGSASTARNVGWVMTIAPANVTTTGTVAATGPAPTAHATGTLRTTGTVAASALAPTAHAAGLVRTTGTIAATAPTPTAHATGTLRTTGAVAVTAPAPSSNAAGTVAMPVVTGTVAATGPTPTASVAGDVRTTGSLAATGPVPTASAVGDVLGPNSGTVAASSLAPTASATGTITTPVFIDHPLEEGTATLVAHPLPGAAVVGYREATATLVGHDVPTAVLHPVAQAEAILAAVDVASAVVVTPVASTAILVPEAAATAALWTGD